MYYPRSRTCDLHRHDRLLLHAVLLFVRVLPAISIAEMRELIRHEGHAAHPAPHGQAAGAEVA